MHPSEPLIESDRSLHSIGKPMNHSPGRSILNAVIGLAFLGMFGSLCFGAYWQLKRSSYLGGQDSALVEVKAIDELGQPIAGAKVFESEQPVGVTDSFGEWRRYSRYELGQTTAIRVVGKINGKWLEATKNFAMPLSPDAPVQFKAVLQLLDPNPVAAAPAAQAAPPQNDIQMDEASESTDPEPEVKTGPKTQLGKEVFLRVNGEWPEDLQTKADELTSKVIPKLNLLPMVTGLDEDRRISLQLLASPQSESLIVVRLENRDGDTQNAVIRSLAASSGPLEDMLKLTIQHLLSQGADARPPRNNWSEQHLNLLGDIQVGDEVFVGGYLARPTATKARFAYFGENLKAVNVTVIRTGQVLARGRIVNRGGGKTVSFSIPKSNVALR